MDIIILFFSIVSFLFFVVGIFITRINIYFLVFKLEKHPILIKMIEDIFQRICKEEGIGVFYKNYAELNPEGIKNDEEALGRYIYTTDADWQKKINKLLIEIENLENKYNMPYHRLCKLVGSEKIINKEIFVLPRILLCNEQTKKYGLLSYYSTHFHELGHHFAVKTMGNHTENDANIIAQKLIIENLPFFFQLFPFMDFRYSIGNKLKLTEKIRAYYEFLLYLRVKNKK